MSAKSYIEFTKIFPDRLKSMRHDKGWNQTELSEFMGVGRALISNWETGKSLPSDEQIGMLCVVSGYDYDYFKGEIDSKKEFSPEFALYTGLSEKAADEILVMMDQNDPLLKTLSLLIENRRLLRCIESAALSEYKDDYLKFANMYVRAETLYTAEKTAVFEALSNFIDDLRKSAGLDPL